MPTKYLKKGIISGFLKARYTLDQSISLDIIHYFDTNLKCRQLLRLIYISNLT